MSITTKRGDKGQTSLCGGIRVSKDNLRVEICGVVDETISFLGLTKSLVKKKSVQGTLENVQKDLFVIGGEVATLPQNVNKLKKRMEVGQIERVEREIAKLEKKRSGKKFCFAIPGKNTFSAYLDVSRTVVRKLERRVVTLSNRKGVRNRHIIVYLNRVSDLLYLLARR